MDLELRMTLAYLRSYPLEATKHLETWSAADIATVMAACPPEDTAPVLELLVSDQAAAVLLLLPQAHAVEILTTLPTHAAIGILRQLEPAMQGDLLARLEKTVGPSLRLSIAYPDGTAASLCDPRVVTLPPDVPVSAALKRITHDPGRATYYHYVVERDGVLVGLVTTKELLTADADQLVATTMRNQLETIPADATEEELLQNPSWRLFHTLPVIDRQGHFLGALRYRTLRQIEARSEIRPTGGPLPGALVQLWEAYALIGLHIMTNLAQALETGMADAAGARKERETSDGTSPKTT